MKTERETPQWILDGAWETFTKETRYYNLRHWTLIVSLLAGFILGISTQNSLLRLRPHTGNLLAFVIALCIMTGPAVLSTLYVIFVVERLKKRKVGKDRRWQKAYLQSVSKAVIDCMPKAISEYRKIDQEIVKKTTQALRAEKLLLQYEDEV